MSAGSASSSVLEVPYLGGTLSGEGRTATLATAPEYNAYTSLSTLSANTHAPFLGGRAALQIEEGEDLAELLLTLRSGQRCVMPSPSLSSSSSSSSSTPKAPEVERHLLTRSSSHLSLCEDEGGSSDYREEEEEEEEEEEDLALEEEEDDEWFDPERAAGTLVRSERGLMGRAFGGRRKAPSGTACEKHKRWKKRCPDDCPMRKFKSRKNPNPPHSYSPPMELSGSESEEEEIDGEDLRTVWRFQRQVETNVNLEDQGRSSRKKRHQNHFDSNSGSPLSSPRPSAHKRKAIATIACERHTLLHARCPANCPERRPAKPHPRSKKARLDREAREETGERRHAQEFGSESDTKSEDESRWTRDSSCGGGGGGGAEGDAKVSCSSKGRRVRVANANPKTKPTRKYLPQACERHKLMHARCPATCPDRLARDS